LQQCFGELIIAMLSFPPRSYFKSPKHPSSIISNFQTMDIKEGLVFERISSNDY